MFSDFQDSDYLKSIFSHYLCEFLNIIFNLFKKYLNFY